MCFVLKLNGRTGAFSALRARSKERIYRCSQFFEGLPRGRRGLQITLAVDQENRRKTRNVPVQAGHLSLEREQRVGDLQAAEL